MMHCIYGWCARVRTKQRIVIVQSLWLCKVCPSSSVSESFCGFLKFGIPLHTRSTYCWLFLWYILYSTYQRSEALADRLSTCRTSDAFRVTHSNYVLKIFRFSHVQICNLSAVYMYGYGTQLLYSMSVNSPWWLILSTLPIFSSILKISFATWNLFIYINRNNCWIYRWDSDGHTVFRSASVT